MILIALGSNVTGVWGEPRETVLRAISEMALYGIRVVRVSSLLVTAPYGVENQPDFVNAVVVAESALLPDALMAALHRIEQSAGRKRQERWGPRTLDLDLLDYHGRIIQAASKTAETLVLPHPGIELRDFVLQPILQIAPEWTHPVTHRSAAESLRRLKAD